MARLPEHARIVIHRSKDAVRRALTKAALLQDGPNLNLSGDAFVEYGVYEAGPEDIRRFSDPDLRIGQTAQDARHPPDSPAHES